MENKLFRTYLGPKAENFELFSSLITRVLEHHKHLRRRSFHNDPSVYSGMSDDETLQKELENFLAKVDKNVPYYHPRYMAQMLKDPSITTVLGYLAFMLSNPNNHAYEGGPVTTEMEMEVTDMLLSLCGYDKGWGHLTSGGSLANLEALWAIRDFYASGAVYFSEVSHYSWKRICKILGITNYSEIPVDKQFRMDVDSLETAIKSNPPMAVIVNIGSTGTGSIDYLDRIIELKERYGFHIHADAAYGGFFRSCILDEKMKLMSYEDCENLSEHTYNQLKHLSQTDSVTIDPHKQGSISYGAGAVLFKDEALKKIILNTAPYTYHLTEKPNIGMFSLEGSRPGAMAAACYLTYKVLPPNKGGIGQLLDQTINSTMSLYHKIQDHPQLENLHFPDLDILCFHTASDRNDVKKINNSTLHLYRKNSLETDNPEFILSKFIVPAQILTRFGNYTSIPENGLTALRAVLMKHWYNENGSYYLNELMRKLSHDLSEYIEI